MGELFQVGSSATFSECKSYRYELVRTFRSPDVSRCVFIMLNPSTANESVNDPTVTRCCNFAKAWGHTSLVVLNLFALRSTNPKSLLTFPHPVGSENDRYLFKWLTAPLTARVVCAWGTWARVDGRADAILPQLRQWHGKPLYCLEKTKNGFPKHPLYIKGDTLPVEF